MESLATSPKTLVDVAYAWLRERILDGTFVPDTKLRVEHLRDESGIGATPLREALTRLAGEKLVRAAGQRGFRVAPMSIAELEDVTENRILIECRAVERSVKQGELAWEAALVAAHHLVGSIDQAARAKQHEFLKWDEYNNQFHDALVSACGSPWLLDMRKSLFVQHTRYRALAAAIVRKRGGRDVEHEHDEIVEAALARQAKKCASLVEDHIRATADVTRAQLATKLL